MIWPRGGLGLVTDKTKNKSRAEQEPRSAHGRAAKNTVQSKNRQARLKTTKNKDNKSRAEQEPRSAHGRALFVETKNVSKDTTAVLIKICF